MRKYIVLALAIFGIVGHAVAAKVIDVRVRAVDGFGGDVGSVSTLCQTSVGMEYDPVVVTRDVNALKSANKFDDIVAKVEDVPGGVQVVFEVRRKMRYVAPARVNGCGCLSVKEVIKKSELRDGEVYGRGDLELAAEKIRKAYASEGYPDVEIEVSVESLRDDACTVVFDIVENGKFKVADYVFIGADHGNVDDLKAAIEVFPWWNYRSWFSDKPISRTQLANCTKKICEYYVNLGYQDVKVKEPERVVRPDGKGEVVFTVEEGPLYTVSSVRVTGLTRYPEAEVIGRSKLESLIGKPAGGKLLSDAAHRIVVLIGSGRGGLADTQVNVRQLSTESNPTALDIEFRVREGVPVVVNDVVIEGNDYTKDKVIRREISLDPGRPMLEDRADQSKRRLENLDYFSRVRYYLRKTNRPKTADGVEYRDLVYEVEEKNTGSFMFGVGASSIDSVYVSAELSQSNFDLFAPSKLFRGAGQKGRLYAQVGPRIQSYEASVTEPYFLDRPLELTVEAYRRTRWYDDYDIIRTGGAGTLSYPVKFGKWINNGEAFGRLGFRLFTEFVQYDDVRHGTWLYKDREVSLDEEERRYGDAVETVGRVFWRRDTRNSSRMPSSGSVTQLFVDLGAGSNDEFWRLGFSHRSYFNVWRRYNHVLMIAARAETIDAFSGDVPIYNRMFLGGPKSIRGIEYRWVSPLARRYRDGELTGSYMPWGGQTLFCMNFEYTIPLVKMLRLAAFTDIGSVGEDEFDLDFGDTFAWTAGLGIRIDIPMFPIRLDFAAPIEKPDHSERETFSFSVGYDF